MNIRVIGLGNVLMRDDGFGPHVVARLADEYECGPGVTLLDAGTPGLDLLPFVTDADALVFVDTVRDDGAPGTIGRYGADVLMRTASAMRLGPHDPGVGHALALRALLGPPLAHVSLIGVVPGGVSVGPGLSPRVHAALAPACERVAREVAAAGGRLTRRPDAVASLPWWERRGPDPASAPRTIPPRA